MTKEGIKRRGFGSMAKDKLREVASEGSKKNHHRHRFTTAEAKAAQEKGLATRRRRKSP